MAMKSSYTTSWDTIKEKTFPPTEKKENCGQLPISGHRSPYRPMAQSERYSCGNTAIAEMRRVLRPRQPAAPDFADFFSHQTRITPTGASSRATRGRWLHHHPSAENPEEFLRIVFSTSLACNVSSDVKRAAQRTRIRRSRQYSKFDGYNICASPQKAGGST